MTTKVLIHSEKVKFKLIPGDLDSSRYYIDIDAFACLLGAMLEENIEDLAFNGFSTVDGNTAGGSHSHQNGMIGDVRYLSKNKNGDRMLLFTNESTRAINSDFDYERQVKFNNALYKFGFARYGNLLMLSENFKNGNETILLPHCQHYIIKRHHNHLHLQGLKLSEILTVKQIQ